MNRGIQGICFAGVLISGISAFGQGGTEEDTFVPGFTAYSEPNPDGFEVSKENGLTEWTQAKNSAVWYGYFANAGDLNLAISVKLPASESVSYRLTAANQMLTARTLGADNAPIRLKFGKINIPKPGYYRFALQGLTKTGKTFGNVISFLPSGPATLGAHFNQSTYRSVASVHLTYAVPKGDQVALFYNEATAKTDPITTYYEVCGWHRGYFGMQVNSATERRIIFSVWDAGKEAVDRSKVADENKVKLLAKGDGVFADSFGNEGTGGHSHLVYNWKTGGTYRFLVTAKIDGDGTIYSGYFYFPEKQAWGLIASFRAPHDGAYPHGLYSFDEDFGGAYGQRKRLAEFGNQWIRTADGQWKELTEARFTHTGKIETDRIDFGAGSVGNRFYLASGGYLVYPLIKYGDTRKRPASGKRPTDIPF